MLIIRTLTKASWSGAQIGSEAVLALQGEPKKQNPARQKAESENSPPFLFVNLKIEISDPLEKRSL
jgi:hypothetical protein